MSRIGLTGAARLRLLAISTSAVLLAIGLAACSSGGGSKGPSVAFVYQTRGDAFQESMVCGAEKKGAELGASLEAQAPSRYSPPAQIQVVNGVAAQQPDALIISPQDPEALYAPVKEIKEAGAAIINIDEEFNNLDIVESLVLADNKGGGEEAARIMSKLIGGKGQVLPIDAAPGLPLLNLRAQGFEDEISKRPEVELLPTRYDNIEPSKTASIVEATLASNPDLKGIYTTTGFGAQGAVTALREEGKIGDVKIVTFDTLPPTVEALENGEVQAAISQKGVAEGEAAMEQAVAAVNGEPVKKRIEEGTVVIDDKTINDPQVRKYTYEEQMKSCG